MTTPCLDVSRTLRLIAGLATSLFFAGGCAGGASSAPARSEQVATARAGAAQPAKNAPPTVVVPAVQKNVTTQPELTSLFGRPNKASVGPDGTETWIYERLRGMDRSAGSTQDRNLHAFFGGAFACPSDPARVNAVRTLSVVVTFNPDKTVKDYSALASYF